MCFDGSSSISGDIREDIKKFCSKIEGTDGGENGREGEEEEGIVEPFAREEMRAEEEEFGMMLRVRLCFPRCPPPRGGEGDFDALGENEIDERG